MSNTEDIQKLLVENKLVLGTGRTMKMLKIGKLAKVYVASNCARDIREDIKYYAELSKTPVVELEQKNEELGTICKKPFFIQVLSVMK